MHIKLSVEKLVGTMQKYSYSWIYILNICALTSSLLFALFLSLLRSGALGVLFIGGNGGLGLFWFRLVLTCSYAFLLIHDPEDFSIASNSLSSVLVATSSVTFLVFFTV